MQRITLNSLYTGTHREETTLHAETKIKWLLHGGIFGLVCGGLAPIVGSLLTLTSWFIGKNSSGNLMHGLGSIFLISTIPLLIFSAFCLDAYEKPGNRVDFDW